MVTPKDPNPWPVFGFSPDRRENMPSCFKPAGFDPVKDALRFHIAPRYTPGSPGLVREAIALSLVRRESDRYNRMINGVEGGDKKEQARRLGLSGIVEERWMFRGIEMFRDLITGETGAVKEREVDRKAQG